MKDFFRNLLGIRQKRRQPPVTPAPQLGATIIRNGVKIKITQPCDGELWDWLLLSGWRVNNVRTDRRKGIYLPRDAIKHLKAATVDDRTKILETLLAISKEGS